VARQRAVLGHEIALGDRERVVVLHALAEGGLAELSSRPPLPPATQNVLLLQSTASSELPTAIWATLHPAGSMGSVAVITSPLESYATQSEIDPHAIPAVPVALAGGAYVAFQVVPPPVGLLEYTAGELYGSPSATHIDTDGHDTLDR
jgi:hypothetical protein